MTKVFFSNQNPLPARLALLLAAAAGSALLLGCPSDTNMEQPSNATAPAVAAAPAGPSVAEQARKNQQSAHVQSLIDSVNRSYQSGVSNYRAGRLDAARLDFDSAVDQMLTSGMDLKTEGPLSEEFDRVVSAVNALELDALKQGNGFSPRVEESPVEAAGELTFSANPELTAKVNAELKTTKSDLPLVVNDYVAGYIAYFSNNAGGHAHLVRSLERAGKYHDMITRILRQEGVPEDFIYQAVAESGFQPQALNTHSGAAGMWQFMPFVGAYGLERNGWFDERFDPEKSTIAYARYMKQLYAQLGDWYLVMAAYDWGPGNVQRAVMRTGYADFWKLYQLNAIPRETKNYVPAMLAAAIMAKNPSQYGLSNVVPEPAVVSDTVNVDYSVDLRLVADLTNSQLTTVVGLNPSLLRMTTPRDMSFDLHLPKGSKDIFLKRIAEIPEGKRNEWRFHVATAGETLETIAAAFHVRAHDLALTNDMTDADTVDPGDELVVPVVAVTSVARPQFYITRRGDTLVTVADRFNVSADDLRRWNHLSSSRVAVGHRLYISEPVRLAPSARGRSRAARRRGAAGRERGSSRRSSSRRSSRAASRASSSHARRRR